MASQPKRKRRGKSTTATSSHPDPGTAGPVLSTQMEDLVKACVAKIIPTIEETCRQFLQGTQQQQQTTAVARQEDQAIPTLLEDITAVASTTPATTGNSTTMFDGAFPQSPQNPRTPTNLTLGVEEKVRTKIYSGEFVNFSSLLPKDLTSEDNDRYKSVEREGQLVFVKAKDKDPIKTINKWMEAFHVFVAVYTEKNPTETSALMAYAQIVKKLLILVGTKQQLLMMKNLEDGGSRTLWLVYGM